MIRIITRTILTRLAETVAVAALAGATAFLVSGYVSRAPRPVHLPPQMRAAIEQTDSPSFGSTHPRVTIVEFSDFECPYCSVQAPILRRLADAAGARGVRVEFRNDPLPIHPWSAEAARLAWCTWQTVPSEFWREHDYLFTHQTELSAGNLRKSISTFLGASASSADSASILTCAGSKRADQAVAADELLAQRAGVTATPTLFVNGVEHVGVISAAELDRTLTDLTSWRRFVLVPWTE